MRRSGVCVFMVGISLCLIPACTRDMSRAKEQAALRELAPNKPVTKEVDGKVVTLAFGVGTSDEPSISDVELQLIADSFPALDQLCLACDDGGITAKGISSLRNLKSLRELLISIPLKPEAIKALAGLENITRLNVVDISNEELLTIAKMPQLTWLSISGGSITDQGLSALGKCKTLKNLSLSNLGGITPSSLDALKDCENLEYLFLTKLFMTQEDGCDFNFLDNHKALPKLREIMLAAIPISPTGFKQIGNKTTLNTLFFFSYDITPKELKDLEKLQKLKELHVIQNKTAVDVNFVQEVLKHKKLKTLDLRDTDITDAAMVKLKKHYEESDKKSEKQLFLRR